MQLGMHMLATSEPWHGHPQFRRGDVLQVALTAPHIAVPGGRQDHTFGLLNLFELHPSLMSW